MTPSRTSKPKTKGKAPASRRTTKARTPSPPKRPRKRAQPKPGNPVDNSKTVVPPGVREHFGMEYINLLAKAIPPDAPSTAFARLLAAGRSLGLDPLRGDLYLARGLARDGGDPEWSVAVRRDALLKYAEGVAGFRGHDEDAIYADDKFERTEPDGDGKTLRQRAGIVHTYSGLDRGELKGAWCAVEVAHDNGDRRPPTVFVARLEDYQPPVASLEPGDPWLEQTAACIIKAAMLWALRIGLGLQDVVGAQEVDRRERVTPAAEVEPPQPEGRAMDDTDERIADLFRQAQILAPTLWLRPLLDTRLNGADDAARLALADEMDESLRPYRTEAAAPLLRRLDELLAFDRADLDEDTARDLDAEIEQVEGRLRAIGAHVPQPA